MTDIDQLETTVRDALKSWRDGWPFEYGNSEYDKALSDLAAHARQVAEACQESDGLRIGLRYADQALERIAGERDRLAEVAEARIAKLEAALREIASYGISRPMPGWDQVVSADVVKIARAALAGDGGGA
jgi:hypothetical protein